MNTYELQILATHGNHVLVKYVTITVLEGDCRLNKLIPTDSTAKTFNEDLIVGTHVRDVSGYIYKLSGLTYCPISANNISV